MFITVIFMLFGLGLSLWAVSFENYGAAFAGLIIIAVVCVSWWFWVMYVIKTMINHTDRTLHGIKDIRLDLQQVKALLEEYESLRKG